MVDPFMALTLGSALITLLVVQPSWKNFASVVVCSLALAALSRVKGLPVHFMAAFSFVGLSSLAVLGMRVIGAGKPNRRLLLYAFLPAILFVASDYMASTLLDFTEALHPKTFDLYLYSFDCSLRVQLSFVLGQMFARYEWLRITGLLFYIALPLPLVYAARLRLEIEKAFPVMLAFLVTGPLGVLFYNMVPPAGPVHVSDKAFRGTPC
jgi:hypothetical protein